MLRVALRKMVKNKWLVACLFFGCLLSVALLSSLPVYSRGVLQRMIQTGFDARWSETGNPPLWYQLRANLKRDSAQEQLDERAQALYEELGLPARLQGTQYRTTASNFLHLALEGDEKAEKSQRMELFSVDGLPEHFEITAGRLPASSRVNGEYEVLASERTLHNSGLMLGSGYRAAYLVEGDDESYVQLRIVGVYRKTDPAHPVWATAPDAGLYMDPEALLALLENAATGFTVQKSWLFALDYGQLQAEDVDAFYETVLAQQQREKEGGLLSVQLRGQDLLEDFFERRDEIDLFLWVLMVPILALLCFYIVMVSSLVYEHDRSEIALMKSRGVGRGRVFLIYLWQALVLAALALAAGLPLGLGLCHVLGSANGFLQFVQRAPLPVTLTGPGVACALLGVGLFLAATLLPVLLARDGSIVAEKHKRTAWRSRPFYERAFLDVLLLALSLLGLGFYGNLTQVLDAAGAQAADMPMNPLLFFLSTLFLFGSALLFSRLYPLLLRLVYRLGRGVWPPALYASLLGASRARSRSRFLMVFLAVTLSLGIFSSVAARTINQNREDRVYYTVGADIRMQEQWLGKDPDPQFDAMGMLVEKPAHELLYSEPPFEKFRQIEGVQQLTRVYQNQRATIRAGGQTLRNANVMAIEPETFSQTAWSRSDLYPYHLNHMMNALIANPNAVLLSSAAMEELGLQHGGEVEITWKNNTAYLTCVLYDGVAFFPTFDPTPGEKTTPVLAVMNYSLVSSRFLLEPYEVWMRLAPGVASGEVYSQLEEMGVRLQSFKAAGPEVTKLHADPLLQGMNGTLTLSFVITMLITLAGFLIFWIIDLRSRQLQLGIIRSLGLPRRSMLALLAWEQLLLSALPMLAGLGIGALAARLFVPMFAFGQDAATAVPPFRVVALPGDFDRVLLIAAGFILAAIAILGAMVSRLKISQTLKLGED